MPLYTYDCRACGPFDTWNTIEDAANAIVCPKCSQPSRRQISLPNINNMNVVLRGALARSERSGTEPKVVKKKHLAGCGCSLCKIGKPRVPPTRYKWMIGH